MIGKTLIIRGVANTDELRLLGLPIAAKFAEADIVIGVDIAGKATAIKSRDQMEVMFVEAQSQLGELAGILKEIHDAYIRAHPKDSHLAHAFVGMWLFFYIGDGEGIEPMPIEMMASGDIEGLRRSAERFVASDFGNKLAEPSSTMRRSAPPDAPPA